MEIVSWISHSERHSQRCDIELKLSVARRLNDEEGFFYQHNLDFRGRAYPIHPHLNHLVLMFVGLSGYFGVCRGSASWKVRPTLAENTLGEFICWWCGQIISQWSNSIY